ncbi:MAG: arginine--tRNA ligase [Planctomycetota bacterium]
MRQYKERAAELLGPLTGLDPEEVLSLLALPPDPAMGDIALPCFALAKAWRKSPADLARELAEKLKGSPPFSRVEASGPYVNLAIDPRDLVQTVLEAARLSGPQYGASQAGRGRTVLIDFSSPNIAKPLAIHHIRSTILGAALARLYRHAGYTVVTLNHLGDWGTNFGQLMVSYKRHEAEHPGRKADIHELLRMYIQFHREAGEDGQMNEEARAWFARLERGDAEAVRLWKLFCEESLAAFRHLYQRLGVSFDHYQGESFFNDRMEATLRRIAERGLSEESEGALVVKLDAEGMPPCLLRKQDGSTLYATRDLAAAEYRHERWRFHKCLYVVANQQELHFRQVFQVLKKMGYAWAEDCVHVKFGMLAFGRGVFDADEEGDSSGRLTGSTRKGRIVFLEEVLDRAAERAREIILENAREEAVKAGADRLAEEIGTSAIIFNELGQRRMKDVTFTWEKALDLHGDSGPYLQYTHARLSSVLRKYGQSLPERIDFSPLGTPFELEVVKAVSRFPESVERAVAENEPSLISDGLLEIAGAFNRFFTDKANHRIVGEEEALSRARAGLVDAVRSTLATGLSLLGLAVPERM